jgi:hypothetical protein
MKIKYEGVEVEFDVVPMLIAARHYLSGWRHRGPLAHLGAPLGLVSSSLFALAADTMINTPTGSWRAAPLLKPLPDGRAEAITSGFPVTGVYDAHGQLTVAAALGGLRRSFTLVNDVMPKDTRDYSLICFGSPTSNLLSEEVFARLQGVLASVFSWGPCYASFTLDGEVFQGGNKGIAMAYTSPWDPQRKVLILAGIGPMGTLACCKLVAAWREVVIARKQRKAKLFLAAVDIDGAENLPTLRRFVLLQ